MKSRSLRALVRSRGKLQQIHDQFRSRIAALEAIRRRRILSGMIPPTSERLERELDGLRESADQTWNRLCVLQFRINAAVLEGAVGRALPETTEEYGHFTRTGTSH